MRAKVTSDWTLLCLSAMLISWSAPARADRASEIESDLREFDQNPAAFMWKVPAKSDGSGNRVVPSAYPDRQVSRPRTRHASAEMNSLSPPSPIESWDQPADLVDQLKYRTLEEMERARLTRGEVEGSPWSDSYWPLYQGLIAQRYADSDFPRSRDWKENADYVLARIAAPSSSSVEALSPAEKYDLLAGDSEWTLTRAMLDEGRSYFESSGTVEGWMGICHGWAPASYMLQRPEKKIEVIAADGQTKIPFFPSDIKALGSLLWANANVRDRFVGRRCTTKSPATDPNGRIIDPACVDTNPATFHQALVNQIGFSKRSFVMDANFDYQVWNQPVLSYQYTYFNPQTQAEVASLAAAKAAISDFATDKFKTYRSRQARAVVGVAVDITYLAETSPSTKATDGPEDDTKLTVRYLYDLELDAQGRLIGGEWYQNAHPDFLWTPPKNAKARAKGDLELDSLDPRSGWAGNTAMPASWRNVIPRSSNAGMPLARAVDTLILLSRLNR